MGIKIIDEDKKGTEEYNIPPDKIDYFNSEIEALTEIEISIPIGRLTLDIFGKTEIPGGAFKGLHKFFEE